MKTERFTFANAEGVALDARLEVPDGPPRACALFAHCFTCSKDLTAAARITRALAGRGIEVLRFDFTGLGGSDGDFANSSYSSNVSDLAAAANALRDRGRAPDLLIGHSLGGAAAITAARTIPEVRAVVSIAAPSSADHLERLLGGAVAEIEARGEAQVNLGGGVFAIRREFLEDLRRQSVIEDARQLGRALLLLHSPVDEIVDVSHARRLYEAAVHPKSFVSLDRADHLLTRREDASYVAELIAAWATRYFAPPEPNRDASGPSDPDTVWVSGQADSLQQSVWAGAHHWISDEPTAVGGDDGGPTPYQLLLAALGSCTSMTLFMYARHKGWPLQQVDVGLQHRRIHAADCRSCETQEGKIDRIDRTVHVRGDLTADQRDRLLEIADRCPVHRTLTSETQIVTRAGPDSPADDPQ